MRDEMDVQRAHDVLIELLGGRLPGVDPLDPEEEKHFRIACDALCWVLRHDHNPYFAANLRKIERLAEAAGYQLCLRTQ